jgi:anti-sigma regulatory factor (Ser/Thr protein kinase)
VRGAGHSRSRVLLRELPSNLGQVDAFCHEARSLLIEMGLSSETFPVEMLLRESLNNAILHGNRGDLEKKIRAEVRIGRKCVLLRITDEGQGFSHRRARKAIPNPEATGGRGLAIYRLYAHRISFNSKGNQVSLWRTVTGERRL